MDAVEVKVNRNMAAAQSFFCQVAGVELSVAPTRASRHKLKMDKHCWIPYGERVSNDEARKDYVNHIQELIAQPPQDFDQAKLSPLATVLCHGSSKVSAMEQDSQYFMHQMVHNKSLSCDLISQEPKSIMSANTQLKNEYVEPNRPS